MWLGEAWFTTGTVAVVTVVVAVVLGYVAASMAFLLGSWWGRHCARVELAEAEQRVANFRDLAIRWHRTAVANSSGRHPSRHRLAGADPASYLRARGATWSQQPADFVIRRIRGVDDTESRPDDLESE